MCNLMMNLIHDARILSFVNSIFNFTNAGSKTILLVLKNYFLNEVRHPPFRSVPECYIGCDILQTTSMFLNKRYEHSCLVNKNYRYLYFCSFYIIP